MCTWRVLRVPRQYIGTQTGLLVRPRRRWRLESTLGAPDCRLQVGAHGGSLRDVGSQVLTGRHCRSRPLNQRSFVSRDLGAGAESVVRLAGPKAHSSWDFASAQVDNTAAIAFSRSTGSNARSRMRHIDLRQAWVRVLRESGLITCSRGQNDRFGPRSRLSVEGESHLGGPRA